jgi:glycerophosphoryl diester phosphodiesterase
VIAHRGASGTLPENTLPAYELAIEQRADMIEIDLHRTRDLETVVTHDESGEIADSDAAEVRALDAGGGEPVPTLDEVLDRFGGRIPFNLELKRGKHRRYEDLEAAALAAVERRGLLDSTLFSSFDDATLAALRRLSPQARLALLVSARTAERALERALTLGAEAVNPSFFVVVPDFVEAAHREGLAVYVYTVDAEHEMRRLLDLGVDGLFTNFPERMRALLESPRGV